MANGIRGGERLSAKDFQKQLRRDLARSRPVPYRRLPGSGRDYYNPNTGQVVSEHYVVRVYRPNLTGVQRELSAKSNRQVAVRTRRYRKSIKETFLMKKQSENPGQTLAQLAVTYDSEFKQLYLDLRAWQLSERTSVLGTEAREEIISPTGGYAQTLVELGRRLPDENKPVNSSPKPKGGYIDAVVVPYYNELRGY